MNAFNLADEPGAGAFRPSPHWTLGYEAGRLLLTAGADETLELDGVPPPLGEEIQALWWAGRLVSEAVSPGAHEILEQLIVAGALQAEADTSWRRFSLRWLGDPLPELQRLLAEFAGRRGLQCAADAPLTLVVRTNGTLSELAQLDLPGPHLLLEVAMHHTLSLGPLVLPSYTSCLACLAGRVSDAWGDSPPPTVPTMAEEPELAAALTVRSLVEIGQGSLRLANRTVAYNLREHEVTTSTLYKFPWCPRCGDVEALATEIEITRRVMGAPVLDLPAVAVRG